MGKNIVVRLHVYLMCFLLAFSPAYTHALSGNPLNFTSVANGAKTAAGFVGDYFFKDYAGTTYSSKGHVVSNGALAKIGRIRMLHPVLFVAGLALSFDVGELVTEMQVDGWTVDPAANKIFKPAGPVYCLRAQYPHVTDPMKFCGVDPVSAVQSYFSYVNPINKEKALTINSDGVAGYLPYLKYAYPRQISISDSNAEVRGEVTEIRENGNYPPVEAQFFLDKHHRHEEHATDQDVEKVLPRVSLPQIQALATSPDYVKEGHSPTTAAAAKAEPTTDKPKDPTKDSSTKCSAGQSFDESTGKCKSATAAQCPAGQVYDFVQKKCMSPKLDDDDEWPEFCEWAAPVCEFIEWAKQDVDKFEAEKVEVEDTADDAQSITSQILTLGYVSGGVKACPSNEDLSFEFMGQSIGFELSYAPLCDMLLTARPVVIAIAYFQAAKIVFVGRRD